MYKKLFFETTWISPGDERVLFTIPGLTPTKHSYANRQLLAIMLQGTKKLSNEVTASPENLWNIVCQLYLKKFNAPYKPRLKATTAQIVFYDLLGLYRGWRHYRGYPVNGQRTRTNGKSCLKNNTIIRTYRLGQFIKMFGSSKKAHYVTLVQAEAMNRLWLKAWPFEWAQGRVHTFRSKPKNSPTIPIDIVNLAAGITSGYKRFGRGERWSSSKKALKTVTVGLPVLFSRYFFTSISKKYFRYKLSILRPENTKKHVKKRKKKKNK